jgi:hypothetical protein
LVIDLIGRHGWLGSDLVGMEGASARWLMATAHSPGVPAPTTSDCRRQSIPSIFMLGAHLREYGYRL